MTRGIHIAVVRVSVLLAVPVTGLLFGSRFFQPFGYAAIAFCWPGLLILGADETQERYGYWGAEIAAATGFSDQSYFDKRFKRAFGQTAKDFRSRPGGK